MADEAEPLPVVRTDTNNEATAAPSKRNGRKSWGQLVELRQKEAEEPEELEEDSAAEKGKGSKPAALRRKEWRTEFSRRLDESLNFMWPSKLPVDTEYLKIRQLVANNPRKKPAPKGSRPRKEVSQGEVLCPAEVTEAFLKSLAESFRSRGDMDALKHAWNLFKELQASGEIHLISHPKKLDGAAPSAVTTKSQKAVDASKPTKQQQQQQPFKDPFKIPTARLLELQDLLREEKMDSECAHVLHTIRARWTNYLPRSQTEAEVRKEMLFKAFHLALDCNVKRAWSVLGGGYRKAKPHPNLADAHQKILKLLKQFNSTRGLSPTADIYNIAIRMHMLADAVTAEAVARKMLTDAVSFTPANLEDITTNLKPRVVGVKWNLGTYVLFMDSYYRRGDRASFNRWADALIKAFGESPEDLIPKEPDSIQGEELGKVLQLLYATGREEAAELMYAVCERHTEPVLAGYVSGLASAGKLDRADDIVKRFEARALASGSAFAEWHNKDKRRMPGLFTYTNLLDGFYRAGLVDKASSLLARMLSDDELDLRPSTYVYVVIARGYAKMERPDACEAAVDLIASIRDAPHGVQPTAKTFNILVDRLLQQTTWKRAANLINRVKEVFGINPDGRVAVKVVMKAIAEGDREGVAAWVTELGLSEEDMPVVKKALDTRGSFFMVVGKPEEEMKRAAAAGRQTIGGV